MTPAEIQAVAKATVDEMWTRNIAGTSNHPLPFWITTINAGVAAVAKAVDAQTGVTLTDGQVSVIAATMAAAIAAKAPIYTGTTILTPTATP